MVVDEAHATGVVGPGGRGLVAELGLEREVDVVVGTLGKALGSYGAFACCDARTASWLVNRARTLIFSTALPPPVASAPRSRRLRLLRAEPERVARLHANARALRAALAAEGFGVAPGADADRPARRSARPATRWRCARRRWRRASTPRRSGRPPCPRARSRLRVVATAEHAEADLREAARILAAARPH